MMDIRVTTTEENGKPIRKVSQTGSRLFSQAFSAAGIDPEKIKARRAERQKVVKPLSSRDERSSFSAPEDLSKRHASGNPLDRLQEYGRKPLAGSQDKNSTQISDRVSYSGGSYSRTEENLDGSSAEIGLSDVPWEDVDDENAEIDVLPPVSGNSSHDVPDNLNAGDLDCTSLTERNQGFREYRNSQACSKPDPNKFNHETYHQKNWNKDKAHFNPKEKSLSSGRNFNSAEVNQNFRKFANSQAHTKPELRFNHEPYSRKIQNKDRQCFNNRGNSSFLTERNPTYAQKQRREFSELNRNNRFQNKRDDYSNKDRSEAMRSSSDVQVADDGIWDNIENASAPVSEIWESDHEEKTTCDTEKPNVNHQQLFHDSTSTLQSSSSEQYMKDDTEISSSSSNAQDQVKLSSSCNYSNAGSHSSNRTRDHGISSPARKLAAVSQHPLLRRPLQSSSQHLPVNDATLLEDPPKNQGISDQSSHPEIGNHSHFSPVDATVIDTPKPRSSSTPVLSESEIPWQDINQTDEYKRSHSWSNGQSYDTATNECLKSLSELGLRAQQPQVYGSACGPSVLENWNDQEKIGVEMEPVATGVEQHQSDYGSYGGNEEPSGLRPEHIASISKLLQEVVDERAGTEVDAQKVVDDINSVLKRHFQDCIIHLYGSYFAGYSLSTSDINLELVSKAEYFNTRFLKEVATMIENEKPDYFVAFEETAKKVVCVEPQCGTSCVICHLGPKSPHYLTSKFIKKIFDFDARIRTLVIALRHWSEVCLVHGPDNERLHPVVLVIMVIYFLQRHTKPILPIISTEIDIKDHKLPEPNTEEVGLLWVSLLKFYAKEFAWREHVISITSSVAVLKKDKSWMKYWIAVEGPFEPGLNIAKNIRSQDIANYIHKCFMQSYKYFSSIPSVDCLSSEGSVSSGCFSSASDEASLEEKHGSEYYYSFDPVNLVEQMDIPHSCVVCDELGYMCEECSEEENDLQEFPPMDPVGIELIDAVLHEAYNNYALQKEEINERVLFVQDLEYYINRRFRDAKLDLIGSSTNGFGFRNSDLDICMTFKNRNKMPLVESRRLLKDLCYHLRRNDDYKSVFALYSAKIPIIQFLHPKTGYRCDISLYNTLALHNTNLLHTYSEIDERAKILGCCLKLLAKKACIADTSRKSLSSYSYVLMVIHYLQRTNPPILPALQQLTDNEIIVEGCNVAFFNDLKSLEKVWKKEENNMSVGELWLDLLRYYIMDIDMEHVISIRHGQIIPKPSTFRRARMFNIEDPFISIKNLGSVMSEPMSVRTYRALVRARKLFGTPIKELPCGFPSFKDYYFDPMSLTDGVVTNAVECELCGKQGHNRDKCRRFNNNFRLRGGIRMFRAHPQVMNRTRWPRSRAGTRHDRSPQFSKKPQNWT